MSLRPTIFSYSPINNFNFIFQGWWRGIVVWKRRWGTFQVNLLFVLNVLWYFVSFQWFQNNNANIQIPLNITIQPTFDRTPFIYGTPKVFSNSLIGPCVYYLCERDGRVKCSICKSWYCSQNCQVSRSIYLATSIDAY